MYTKSDVLYFLLHFTSTPVNIRVNVYVYAHTAHCNKTTSICFICKSAVLMFGQVKMTYAL